MTRRENTFRGLAVFAAVWHGLWLIGDANLRRIVVSNPWDPAVIALIVSMIMWVALWPSLFGPLRDTRRLRVLQVASMLAVVVGGLLLLSETTAVGDDGWFVGASVLNLGAGLAALYLNRRVGVVAVMVIVGVEASVITLVHGQGTDAWPLMVDLIYPFYALALGMAGVASRYALMESALGQDLAQRLLQRQQRAREINEVTDLSLTAAETRLHETVLNTLTAIVRGGLTDDAYTRVRLRERARESADVLRAITDGSDVAARWSGDLRVDLAGAIVDLESSGIRTELEGILDLDMLEGQFDDSAFPAAGSAVREALINALRHSGATSVHVTGDVRTSVDGIWWRIRIRDDGRGFDTRKRGYGLQSVIETGIRDCGGRVAIRSGRGTTVTIDLPMASSPTQAGPSSGGYLPAIAIPVITAFTAFTLYTVGATWQYAGSAVANTAAVALFVVIVAVVLVAARAWPESLMPWWVIGLVLVIVPAMTLLERIVPGLPNPSGDWTSEAGSALLFVVVATGPMWAGPAAAVSWFIAQETAWIELTQPGMFVIVVAAVLGWQLRRGRRRSRNMDVEVSQERAALAASQHRLAQARRRYQDVDMTRLIELLDEVAEGEVDPANEAVRAICLREERMIRSVIRLHPEAIGIHRDLVALAVAARDADVDLSISVASKLPDSARLTTGLDAQRLLASALPGSQARASIADEAAGCTFRLVVQVAPEQVLELPPRAEVLDERECLVALEEVCGSGHNADMTTGDGRLAHEATGTMNA